MKKRFLVLLVLVLLLPAVFAQVQNIVIGKTKGEAVISPLGQAKFTITVANTNAIQDIILLELSDVAWSLITKEASDLTTGIVLSKYEKKNTTVYIRPDPNIEPGTYYVELRMRSTETKTYSSEVFTIKIDPKIMDYSVTVSLEILEPTSIDPQKTNSVKVLLKNPNLVYITNLIVSAKSKFLDKSVLIEVPPKSEKVLEFSLNIDASTPKQEDLVTVTAVQNGKEIGLTQKTIYIKEYRLPYKQEVKAEKRFLYKVNSITFTNTESAQKTRDAFFEKPNTWSILFTSPEATEDNFDGKDYFVWKDLTLNPDESYTVLVVEDYRTFALIALLVILGIIVYFNYRSPIIIKKRAYGIHKKDTGNNEIKVMLYVKNRSRRFLEKVRVLERLPIIHKVDSDFGAGTPEPKFRRGADGLVLDWDIALAPKEERIFTYKIKSALPIVGEYTLKPCVVQYGKDNRRTASSPYRLIID